MIEVLRILGAISFSAGVIMFLFGFSSQPVFAVGLAVLAIGNGVLLIGFAILIEQGRDTVRDLSRLADLQQLQTGRGSHDELEPDAVVMHDRGAPAAGRT